MDGNLRRSGIEIVGNVPWASHFCQFYQTREDLLDMLVPYFKAGLENNEAGMWVTSEPLTATEAKEALARAVPDLERCLARGQMEIVPYTEWYMKGGYFDLNRVLNGWVQKLEQAMARGYDGMRVTGNTAWLEKKDWKSFADYETAINGVIGERKLLALCTYWLDKCTATEIVDVIRNHEFALIKQEGRWELFENSSYKATKEALVQSEERLHNIFEESPVGIELYDAEGRLVTVNKSCLEIFGVADVNEVKGFKLFEDPNVTSEAKQRLRCGETVRYEAPFDFEKVKQYRLYRTGKSGTSLLDVVITPLRAQGSLSGYLVLVQDITERKGAEEGLRRSEGELATILASVPVIVLVVDSRRYVIRANDAAARFAGRTPQEMVGLLGGEALRCLHYLDDPRGCGFGPACQTCKTRLTILDTFETGKGHYQVEWHLPFPRNDDQQEVTFLLSTVLLTPSRDQVLICIEDISERKMAEEEIKNLNASLLRRAEELEIANKELEAFSYSVSHDLRAPLRSLDGFSQALLEDYADKLDREGKESLQLMREQSQLMGQLIDDILKLSRVTRAEIYYQKVDLSELAEEVTAALAKSDRKREVKFAIAPGLNAYGDVRLLRLVLENLLGNAWKFTAKTSGARIQFDANLVDGERAFFVRDNGVGFKMAYADKLFKPFQRLHSTEEFAGTGIGLATVQRIVHRLGGRVWAEGEVGKGATFYFTLE